VTSSHGEFCIAQSFRQVQPVHYVLQRNVVQYSWSSGYRGIGLQVQYSLYAFRFLCMFSAGACVRFLYAIWNEYVEEHAAQPPATVVG